MKDMFLYELKKIFSRKIVWVGILVILFFNIANYSSMGISDISYEQEIADRYKGILDDEKVQQMLADFMPSKEELEMWKGVPVSYIGMNSMQQAVHFYFANADGTWNGKTVKDVFGDQRIQVGYHSGWFEFSRILAKVMLSIGVLSVIISSSVFAEEYSGMDNILLTSRYGRRKCASAKILAALASSLGFTLLFLMGNIVAAMVLIGKEGLDSSTLFCGIAYENYMPFNISCGTMLMYQIGLTVSGIMMIVGIAVAVSAISKSQVLSLIIAAFLFLFPVMIPLEETNPLFRIIALCPIWQIMFSGLMSVKQIGGNLFYAAAAFPVSVAVMGIGIVLAQKFWKNHQVV